MAEAAVGTTPTRRLDLALWPRREAFEYFRRYDKPFFNVCTKVDVAPLRQSLAGRGSVIAACHWLALELAQRVEPMRYRIAGDEVHVHPQLEASTTVLRDDGAIAFARLPYLPRCADFLPAARAAIEAARRPGPFTPLDGHDAMLHFTTLPWIHFTSFSHARKWRRDGQADDSIPKIAFGRFEADGARSWMPLSVEVHHALMDGLHVGQFVQGFEALLATPEPWLEGLASASQSGTAPSTTI